MYRMEGKTYEPRLAFGQSKTANILFITGGARSFETNNVSIYAPRPGSKLLLGC